ncbi:glycosyltransferase [Shewanella litorisediminis]|uniref:Glycosyltransferase n=1 Tax=Shewanella litorisediminis TaxID=1173586 RepID=A0ABX7G3P4_9GAMM|nr:glycosyltransferase [Shewanella litorisediminis]MCL2919425.1 glycosyltransferase [Shewanella litorisediminis]QRH01961.1 glycosyltransferase [Shewanella litorisediminis]
MKKRVAIVIDSLAGGGAERVMLTLASSFLEAGHSVDMITLEDDREHSLPPGLRVHCCFGAKSGAITGFWRAAQSAAKLGRFIGAIEAAHGPFDLILSNLDKANLLMARLKLPHLFFVVHNSVEEELKRQRKLGPLAYFSMLRAKLALTGKRLVAVSRGIADEILQTGRIHPLSIEVIYNPFDFPALAEKASEPQDLPKGDYLVHVGRMAKQKRHDVLFQALAQSRHGLPLVLLCQNVKKARKLAKKYGVEDRLILPGFQTNPYPWIKEAKLLVLSSDYEGLPTVLIEALALGTSVVSTDCPHGPNEILTGELKRFLVPRRDSAALAAAMDDAVNHAAASDALRPALPESLRRELEATQVMARYLALCDKS